MHITPDLFTAIPKFGRVTFDFCGSDYPPAQCMTISDVRLTNVLFNVAILNKVQKMHALNSLAMLSEETLKCIRGDGFTTPAVDTRAKAKGIRLAIDKFYSKLHHREKQIKKSFKNEELRIGLKKGSATSFAETDKSSDTDSSSDSDSDEGKNSDDDHEDPSDGSDDEESGHRKSKGRKISVVEEALALTLAAATPIAQKNTTASQSEPKKIAPVTAKKVQSSRIGFVTESKTEYTTSNARSPVKRTNSIARTSSSSSMASVPAKTRRPFNPKQLLPQKSSFAVDESNGRVVRKLGNILTLTGSEKHLLEIGRKFINMSNIDKISNHAKCIRIIQALEDILGRVWILSKHLAIIVGCFQLGLTLKTENFGTYRVELVISLFCRVVDLHNFDLVLGVLTPPEVACVICRLGYLNIFNPLKPEGCYCLDFSIREERIIAKMIGALSYQEPGVNFVAPRFRWEWGFEDIPGWSLLPTWIDDTVFPHRGILAVQYDSGDGVNNHGCFPDPVFRRSLLAMVFIFIFFTYSLIRSE